MKKIKRLDVFEITQKFGLNVQSADFVFKPQEATLTNPSEPHRSEMYGFGFLLKGSAELRVGLESYHAQAPGLVAISPDEIRQWVHRRRYYSYCRHE